MIFFLRDQGLAEELHVERALGARVHLFGHPLEVDRRRFRGGVDVREHELFRLGLRNGGSTARSEDAGHASAAGEQGAARELEARHGCPPM